MEVLNIVLHLKNAEYAKSLARGLCYETTGLNVFFASDLKTFNEKLNRGILLTDKREELGDKAIFLSNDPTFVHKNQISKAAPLRLIVDEIRRLAFSEYGIYLISGEKQTKIIEVFSEKGGLGVTSFAITLARLLGLKTEQEILYFNLGIIDDYECYLESISFGTLSKEEFVILKEKGLNVDIRQYLQRDIWNVYYFRPEKRYNSFFNSNMAYKHIEDMLEAKDFDYVIVDSGKRKTEWDSPFKKQVEVLRDSLIYRELDTCKNFEFNIPRDEESFLYHENYIEISMRGKYAEAIGMFIDKSELQY